MKKNRSINHAKIESLSHDGRGIAHIDDKITFIDYALPNEEVSFTYTKRKNKFNNGKVLEVINPSPERVVPICKHYMVCGGCSLQHLKHQGQIDLKEKILKEHLKHIGNIEIENLLLPILGPITQYRGKARLSARYVLKKEKVLVGFREKNSSFVVDSEECPILHESVGGKIHLLSKLIEKLSIYKYIPQIEVACGDKITALVFRNLQSFSNEDIKLLTKFGKEHNLQIYSQSGGINTIKNISLEQKCNTVNYKLPKYNIEIMFAPTDFTQINQAINIQLIDRALELLDLNPEDKILDLFCGIGNFTLPIATKCKHVVGVEGSNSAVIKASMNASNNNITNAEFYTYDLTKELPIISWGKEEYDKILLDPPRTGAIEICEQIKKFKAKIIVYISCNPATFARDAKVLTEHGYELQSVSMADMYPHTSHMETIASFVQNRSI